MEKVNCPYCGKLTSNDICEFCNNKISEYTLENKYKYDFDIAVFARNKDLVTKLISYVDNNNINNYYYLYLNNKFIDYSIYSDLELLIIADYEKSTSNVEKYISSDKLQNLEEVFNVDLINQVDIKYEEKEDTSRKDGKTYIIIGLASSVVMILLSLLIAKEVRTSFLVFLLIIPALIFSNGILKFGKFSKLKLALLSFLFILVVSYIGLIYLNTNFIKHTQDVILSLFNILKYYSDKGSVNWKYMGDMNLKN